MQAIAWTLVILAVLALFFLFVFRPILRAARRRRLQNAPFPAGWESILKRTLPLYLRMPALLRERLRSHIQVFVAEKNFEGCGGLEITDEIRVTIAAQACLLGLNLGESHYPKLITILVYPGAYVAGGGAREGMIQTEEREVRLGESWNRGMVVLAWDHVKQGARDIHDGQNVVLHEFAHQLDQEDGHADGAPVLDHRSRYITWARILGEEYASLRKRVFRGKKDVLDAYGAQNPAEFFAVVTEAFFEKPKRLKEKHLDLYKELKNYYRMDPASWD